MLDATDASSDPMGPLLFVFAAALLLTAPLALWVLARYRRAVARAMGIGGPPGGSGDTAHPVEPAAAARSEPPPRLADGLHPLEADAPGRLLVRRARRSVRGTALAVAGAGFAYAAAAGLLVVAAQGAELLPLRTLVVVLVHAWPVVPGLLVVTGAGRVAWLVAPLAYVLLLAAVAGSFLPQAVALWGIFAGPPTLALVALSARSLRAVGPLLFLITAGALGGALLSLDAALWALQSGFPGARLLARGAAIAAFAGGLLVGLLGLRALARGWVRRRLSDQLLLLAAWWLVFTFWLGLFLRSLGGAGGATALSAFAAFALVLALLLALRRREATRHSARPLLLLRVFGSRSRSERLFVEVARWWRHLGPVRLVAAPDLASATFEPDELLSFLAGRLGDRFVDAPADLERRLAGFRDVPDPDGRYRVEKLYCRDHTWRQAVARLVERSDVVLVDLRGYTAANLGVREELSCLVETVPAGRIVLLEDDSTDEPAARAALAAAWAACSRHSPNFAAAYPVTLHLGRQGVRALLAALCDAAALAHPGAAPNPAASTTTPGPTQDGHPSAGGR